MTMTTCELTSCQAPLRPTGDASVTTRCHPIEGGKYFCTEACAKTWERTELITGQVVGRPDHRPRQFTSVTELRAIEAERYRPQ